MQPTRTLAITLRTIPYEERHRIVTALTEEHGRITGMARNAVGSRRFGGALEPFVASVWTFVEKPGAEMGRIDGAEIRHTFEGIRKDFHKLSLASALSELALRLAHPGEPAPDLFRLHSNALMALEESYEAGDEASPAGLRILNAYLIKALHWAGHSPLIHRCLSCSTPLTRLEPFASRLPSRTDHQKEPREEGTVPSPEERQTLLKAAEPVQYEQRPNLEAPPLLGLVSDAGWICPSCRKEGTRHVHRGVHAQSGKLTVFEVSPTAMMDCFLGLTIPVRQVPERFIGGLEDHKALFSYLEALLIFHVPGFDRTPLKSLKFLGLDSSLNV